MTQTPNTWHILGAGAIGCLWAIRLQTAGVPVRLILSERKLLSLRGSTQLKLEFLRGATVSRSETISLDIAELDEQPHNLLLATKANDAVDALRSRKNSLDECQNIVTLCNGMGYHSAIQDLLPASNLFAVSTTDGAYFSSEGCLVMAGKGTNKISRIKCDREEHKHALKSLARQLSTRGHRLHTRIYADGMLMDKLLINACINGLTAIHDCRNGGLLASGAVQTELNQLIGECQTIAATGGFARQARQLHQRVNKVISGTRNNYSSTYMDVKLGRQTEIDHINGYLCRFAAELLLQAPLNTKIVSSIQQLEKAAPPP